MAVIVFPQLVIIDDFYVKRRRMIVGPFKAYTPLLIDKVSASTLVNRTSISEQQETDSNYPYQSTG
jgi:hypothetical protein